MKHYVVVCDWASDYQQGVDIVKVAHTYEEALDAFDKRLEEERKIVAEHDEWQVFIDARAEFQAYEEGYYVKDHTYLYIEEAK